MSFDSFPVQTSEPELKEHITKFVGGTTAVTKVFGKSVTVTYVSTGVVDLVFSETPGAFVGCLGYCFEATTQADLKGFTMVPGVMNTTTNTLRVKIYNSSFALADLAALNWLTLKLAFKTAQSSL